LRQYLNTQRLPALVAEDRQFLIQIKDVAATPQFDEKVDGCGLWLRRTRDVGLS
jgi:hypothetical protein